MATNRRNNIENNQEYMYIHRRNTHESNIIFVEAEKMFYIYVWCTRRTCASVICFGIGYYRFYAKKFPLSCRRHAGSRCEAFLAKTISGGLASGYVFLSFRIFIFLFFVVVVFRSYLWQEKKCIDMRSEKQYKFSSMYRWHRLDDESWSRIMTEEARDEKKERERDRER